MTSEAVIQSDIQTGAVDVRLSRASWSPALDGLEDLFTPTSVAGILDVVVSRALTAFRADAAGVLLMGDEGVAASAASRTDARRADALQIQHHQGPALQAINGRQPVVSPELRFDSRWRFWAPQAADLGFRSVLSLALTESDPFGAITLYSDDPSHFGTDSLAPGLEFAHQASLAITAAAEPGQAWRTGGGAEVAGLAQSRSRKRYQVSPDSSRAVLRRPSHLRTRHA
jgi:uncharacterized protein YigA (DUF484 family)